MFRGATELQMASEDSSGPEAHLAVSKAVKVLYYPTAAGLPGC